MQTMRLLRLVHVVGHFALWKQVMFMKNVAMLGGALLITYFGAGPISIDARH